MLLPGASLEEAAAIGQALVDETRAMVVESGTHRIGFTLSLGAARYLAGEDFDALVARADAALYRAKREGRDRVIAA